MLNINELFAGGLGGSLFLAVWFALVIGALIRGNGLGFLG